MAPVTSPGSARSQVAAGLSLFLSGAFIVALRGKLVQLFGLDYGPMAMQDNIHSSMALLWDCCARKVFNVSPFFAS